MKKDEAIYKCSNLDDVIAISQGGILKVSKVSDKAFGKNLLHIDIFNRTEPNSLTFCMVYRDGRTGPTLAKHFQIGGITRDKEYDLTKGKPGSRIFYISCYPTDGGGIDAVRVNLSAPASERPKSSLLQGPCGSWPRDRRERRDEESVRNVVRLPKSARADTAETARTD